MSDSGKHAGQPSDRPWNPPPQPPSPDGSGPGKAAEDSTS